MVLQIIQDADIAKLIDFVNNGGDVFVQDADGNDAMYYATKSGNEEIVAMLEMLAEGMGKSLSTSIKSTDSKTRSTKRRVQGDAGECAATIDKIWDELLPKATTREEIEKYVLALKKQDFRFNANLGKISDCFYKMEVANGLDLVDVIWDNYELEISELLHLQLQNDSITKDDDKRYQLKELIIFSLRKDIAVITRCAHCINGDGSLAHRIIIVFPEEESLEIFEVLKEKPLPSILIYCAYGRGWVYNGDFRRPAQTLLEYAIWQRKPKIVRFYLSNCLVGKDFFDFYRNYRACEFLHSEIERDDKVRRNSMLWPINKLWDSGYISPELLEIYAYFVEAKRQVMEYGEVKFPEKLVFNKYREYKWDEWL